MIKNEIIACIIYIWSVATQYTGSAILWKENDA